MDSPEKKLSFVGTLPVAYSRMGKVSILHNVDSPKENGASPLDACKNDRFAFPKDLDHSAITRDAVDITMGRLGTSE